MRMRWANIALPIATGNNYWLTRRVCFGVDSGVGLLENSLAAIKNALTETPQTFTVIFVDDVSCAGKEISSVVQYSASLVSLMSKCGLDCSIKKSAVVVTPSKAEEAKEALADVGLSAVAVLNQSTSLGVKIVAGEPFLLDCGRSSRFHQYLKRWRIY